MNAGCSSTTGILVAMSRIKEVVYDSTTRSVTIGAGCVGPTRHTWCLFVGVRLTDAMTERFGTKS